MALTIAPDFTDGTPMAAKFQQLADAINERTPLVAAKTLDESVTSSAALQLDDELAVTLPVNSLHLGMAMVFANSAANAAGDIQIAWTFPAGGTCHFGGAGPHNSLASGSQADGEWIVRLSATSGSTNIPYGLSTSGLMIVQFVYIQTAGTGGAFTLTWAQQTSNVNSTTVRAGSHMRFWRVS